MSRLASALVGALTIIGLAACSEGQLTVANKNAPDETRALASATDVENLVVSQFRAVHQNSDGLILMINSQLHCAGMENASGLGNAEMGKACGIPRVPTDNTRGNGSLIEKYNPYLYLNRAARSVAMGLNAMNQPSFTFLPPNVAQVARDKAFGYFTLGVAQGDIALVYDSGAVISPNDDMSKPAPPLVGADSLMKVALAYLDSALAYTSAGSSEFPLDASWINGNALSDVEFAQLVHSWKARLRAGVARDVAGRSAVDWGQVVADAAAGITSDFEIEMTTGSPPWTYRPDQMDLYGNWHQMWQYILGMADAGGKYDLYLAAPGSNSPFLVVSPDRRFPQGVDRPTQNTASGCLGGSGCLQPAATAPYPYLRNRLSGSDTQLTMYMMSMYDFYRFQAFFNANRNGPIPTFTMAELNMLAAEGMLRSGAQHNAAAAIALINQTRTAAGLPAVTGDSGTTVPGGASCVPRVPDPATNFSSSKCGTVWEAMKWEKRMETAYTHWGAWWVDGRGWGDLPIGTVEEYPTPYQELDTRVLPIYSASRQAATVGTYGL